MQQIKGFYLYIGTLYNMPLDIHANQVKREGNETRNILRLMDETKDFQIIKQILM